MDDLFTEKIKLFLSETGFVGDIDKIDFSFLAEHKGIVDLFTNTSNISENVISKDELELANTLKNKNKFIESEEKLDEILLQEYGCDVSKDCIDELDILSLKDKITEVKDNIDILNNLNELSKLEYKNSKIDLEKSKENFKNEESKMKALISKSMSYDQNFLTLAHEINDEYKSYKDLFEHDFLEKKPSVNFQMALSSQKHNRECAIFKNNVIKYINSCHKYSSIVMPGGHLNTTESFCHSTFCSTVPEDFSSPALINKLSTLKVSMKRKFFNKISLEAEANALSCCLQYLKEELNSQRLLMLLHDQINYSENNSEVNDGDDNNHDLIIDCTKTVCSKWAELQVTKVFNDLYESKMSKRREKLLALDNFLKIVKHCCAILDLLWMLFKTECELYEHYYSAFTTLISSLDCEFKQYLKRKEHMEVVSRQSATKLQSPINPTMKCIQNILLPLHCHFDEDEIAKALKELVENVYFTEEKFLESSHNICKNIFERFKDCKSLYRRVLKPTTINVSVNNINMKTTLENFKCDINGLTEKIACETSQCLLKQENLSQDELKNQFSFLWVTFLIEPEKLKNMLQE